MNAGKRAVFPTVLDIRESIKGRGPIHVKNVKRASNGALTSVNIRESTLGRNLMDVLCVGSASVRVQPSLHIRELTLEKNLINVLNVEKALDRVHTLSDTKGSIEIKSYHFDILLHELFCFFSLPKYSFFGLWSISVNHGLYFLGHHTQDRFSLTQVSRHTLIRVLQRRNSSVGSPSNMIQRRLLRRVRADM